MYKGNFIFDEHDFNENDCCIVCGKPYESGYFDSEGDGAVSGGVNEFYIEPEKACICSGKDLHKKIDDFAIDGYGFKLLERLREVDGLSGVTESDVCRLSEAAGKTFKELCEYTYIDSIVELHIKVWSSYVMERLSA